jgi:hypothetical protein
MPKSCEEHVSRLAPLASAPIEIKFTVAFENVVCFVEAQQAGSPVNPGRRPFQFQVNADRRLVERDDSRFLPLELSPVFFVAKYPLKTEPIEDGRERSRIVSLEFQFFPLLVLAGGWWPFVSELGFMPDFTDAQKRLAVAQTEIGRIENLIRFKYSRLLYYKSVSTEQTPCRSRAWDSDFHFDFHRQTERLLLGTVTAVMIAEILVDLLAAGETFVGSMPERNRRLPQFPTQIHLAAAE